MRSPIILLSALVVVCMSHAEAMTELTGPSHTTLYSNNDRFNTNKRNMMEVLNQDRRFSRLCKVIAQAGSNLKNDLEQGNRDKTLLAPTNDAFDAMEESLNVRIENMNRNDLSELLMYHMIPKRAVNKDNLCNGDLLETALTQKGLGGHRQVIRVGRHGQRVRLNMYSRIVESNIETENGMIQAISEVMHVPSPMFEQMTKFPSVFSTHALAMTLTGMDKKMDEHTKMTALLATNEAWESIGFGELMELFQPENREELKKMMMKHIVPEMIYVHFLAMQKGMSENQCARQQGQSSDDNRVVAEKRLPTLLGEEVTLRVVCRGGELRSIIDEASITLQDIPCENGVMQLMAQPLVLNKSNRRHRRQPNNPNHRNNDMSNRRPRSSFDLSSMFDQNMFTMNRNYDNDNYDYDIDNRNNRRNNRRNRRNNGNNRNNDDYDNNDYEVDNRNNRRNNRNNRNNDLNNKRRRSPRDFSTVFDVELYSMNRNYDNDNDDYDLENSDRRNRHNNPNYPEDDDQNRRHRRRRDGRDRRNYPDNDYYRDDSDDQYDQDRNRGRRHNNGGRRNGRRNNDFFNFTPFWMGFF